MVIFNMNNINNINNIKKIILKKYIYIHIIIIYQIKV